MMKTPGRRVKKGVESVSNAGPDHDSCDKFAAQPQRLTDVGFRGRCRFRIDRSRFRAFGLIQLISQPVKTTRKIVIASWFFRIDQCLEPFKAKAGVAARSIAWKLWP